MIKQIDVRRKPGGSIHEGLFTFNGKTIYCSLGRSGITTQKHEGDGATPAGIFEITDGYYRKDRVKPIATQIPLTQFKRNAGWCDEPTSPNYNTYVSLPFSQSHENMIREDRLYDVCIVLNYNLHPRKRYGGSAIFFHQTREDRCATEGCVAISPEDMRMILPKLTRRAKMTVHA